MEQHNCSAYFNIFQFSRLLWTAAWTLNLVVLIHVIQTWYQPEDQVEEINGQSSFSIYPVFGLSLANFLISFEYNIYNHKFIHGMNNIGIKEHQHGKISLLLLFFYFIISIPLLVFTVESNFLGLPVTGSFVCGMAMFTWNWFQSGLCNEKPAKPVVKIENQTFFDKLQSQRILMDIQWIFVIITLMLDLCFPVRSDSTCGGCSLACRCIIYEDGNGENGMNGDLVNSDNGMINGDPVNSDNGMINGDPVSENYESYENYGNYENNENYPVHEEIGINPECPLIYRLKALLLITSIFVRLLNIRWISANRATLILSLLHILIVAIIGAILFRVVLDTAQNITEPEPIALLCLAIIFFSFVISTVFLVCLRKIKKEHDCKQPLSSGYFDNFSITWENDIDDDNVETITA